MKRILLAILLVLFSATAMAVVAEDEMKIYAVTTGGNGLVATLHLEIEEGEGQIWSSVTPLVGTTTQNAERTAIKVAREFTKNVDEHDFKFTIDSTASVVDGPSAGAAMAILAISMLTDRDFPDNVSITGTVNEEGRVGPVGGIYEKAREASNTDIELFLIPKGEAVQTVKLESGVKSVNLLEYAPEEWGMKVAEVENVEQALKLAFSDIDEIDVNISTNAVPEFVPEKLQLPEHMGSFKLLTADYIKETRQVTEEARNALSSSLLEDPEIINFLLSVLNDAEQTTQRAEILDEQNYLYSAANFAFLARVNAIMVREISNNPSLLNKNSTAFELKMVELQKELNNFEQDLSGTLPKKNTEWFVSAQQRFIYADNTLQKLRNEQTIVINGNEEDEILTAMDRLSDYAFAKAWVDVGKDFYNISIETDEYVLRGDEFEDKIDVIVAEAEDNLAVIGGEEPREDILRRVNAAKKAKEMNWFESGLFDAASAKALSASEIAVKDKSHEELVELLESKIKEIEGKIGQAKVKAKWSELYLAHAKYFLESANYYDERDLQMSSNNNLVSGISLAFLADELFAVTSEVNRFYDTQEVHEVKNVAPQRDRRTEAMDNELFIASLILFGLAFFLILMLVIVSFLQKASGSKGNRVNISKQINQLHKMIRDTDELLFHAKIDRKTHSELKKKYTKELQLLEKEMEESLEREIAIDEYSAAVSAHKAMLEDLKKHRKKGIISKSDFEERAGIHMDNIAELQKKLETRLEPKKTKRKPASKPKSKVVKNKSKVNKKKE